LQRGSQTYSWTPHMRNNEGVMRLADRSNFFAFGHNGAEIRSSVGVRSLKSLSLFFVLFNSLPISLSPLRQ
jgi:hypothetical protein